MSQLAQHRSPATPFSQAVLQIDKLQVSFPEARAVDGVSLTIHPRQTVALVGESGCGKSMTALSVLRLIPRPGAITAGSVRLNGNDLMRLTPHQMRRVRGRDVAMIFQEPMSSLNPVLTVGDQIVETIQLHQHVRLKEARAIAIEALRAVGISNPARQWRAYPHQFSGGMRQRVMIAMALACQPRLLLADEPTTALDVTIQAQILQLLHDLQRSQGMGIMFITHDLGIVAQHADVVGVMYAGRVVEYANVFELFDQPLHPYTRALLRCRPSMRQRTARLTTVSEVIEGVDRDDGFIHAGERVTPWWPQHSRNESSHLREIQSGHFIACSGNQHDTASSLPNLDFRRDRD